MTKIIIAHLVLIALLFFWQTEQKRTNHPLKTTTHRVIASAQPVTYTVIENPYQSPPVDNPIENIAPPPPQQLAPSPPKTPPQRAKPPPPIDNIAPPPPQQPARPPSKTPPEPAKPTLAVAKKTAPGEQRQEGKPTKQGDYRKVLEMMENSLSALETKSSSPLSPIGSTAIGPLKSETIGYTERLISLLKQMLIFPDSENVTVEIQVSSAGRVLSCTVVESSSLTNRDYVLSVLPHLQLPPFDGELKGKASHTFKVKLIADL